MKRSVKRISFAIAAFVTIMITNGCNKAPVWYTYFGLEDMYYILAEEKTAVKFFNELSDIMNKYDGTNIDENKMKDDIDRVVKRYDNGVLSGSFSSRKSNNLLNDCISSSFILAIKL